MQHNEDIEESTLCPGCFREKGDEPICTQCGFDERTDSSPAALRLKAVLHNRYLVGRVLVEPDRMGMLYLGWDIASEARVTIIEFFPPVLVGRSTDRITVLPHSNQDAEVFNSCLRVYQEDVLRLVDIKHPNLARIRDVFEANGTVYLIADYIEGQTLSTYLEENGKLSEYQAITLLDQVLEGLEQAHRASVLHGGISPDNIILDTYVDGSIRPVVYGFGAARAMSEAFHHVRPIVLKPGYAPYEQYLFRGEVGAWTDVYACAAILYRMVTGFVPPEALNRLLHDQLVSPTGLGLRITPTLENVLRDGLNVYPEGRPPSIRKFREQLLQVFRHNNYQNVETWPGQQLHEPKNRTTRFSSEDSSDESTESVERLAPPVRFPADTEAAQTGDPEQMLLSGEFPYPIIPKRNSPILYAGVGLLVVALLLVGLLFFLPERVGMLDGAVDFGVIFSSDTETAAPESKYSTSVDELMRSADSLYEELDRLERMLQESESQFEQAERVPAVSEETPDPGPEISGVPSRSNAQSIEEVAPPVADDEVAEPLEAESNEAEAPPEPENNLRLETIRVLNTIRQYMARADNARARGEYGEAADLYHAALANLNGIFTRNPGRELLDLRDRLRRAQSQNREACEVEARIAQRRGETPPVCR